MEYNKVLTVFEHQSLYVPSRSSNENASTAESGKISRELFDILVAHYGDGVPYYKLIANGVQFNQYVGIIQVGRYLIEVLPKADRLENDQNKWRGILITMLKKIEGFKVHQTNVSSLNIHPNTILDLYFAIFVQELQKLIHQGLMKRYRKQEQNCTALKGRLLFAKHLQRNLTHQERFYVSTTVFDKEHLIHELLFKALNVVAHLNSNQQLNSSINNLLVDFPEQKDIRVIKEHFEKIPDNRKTAPYKSALNIAKMILLHYYPDVSQGKESVLALMFDMNLLWEQYVFVALNAHLKQWRVEEQRSKPFWQKENKSTVDLKPDIFLTSADGKRKIIIDTKWKLVEASNPSPEDLRQMYAYHDYWEANKTILLYPSNKTRQQGGRFVLRGHECSMAFVYLDDELRIWQNEFQDFL